MKMPNGYGSIVKLSGNRRRPFMVRITTARTIENGKYRQIRKVIGYYPTRKEALSALARYNDDPYDPDVKGITFAEVYERWSPEDTIGASSVRMRVAAFRHCAPLHDIPIRDIRAQQIESLYKSLTPSQAHQASVLIHHVFRYALRHDLVMRNYAEIAAPPKRATTQIRRQAFDSAQIAALRKDSTDISKIVFVAIMTGFRPQELTLLRSEDVDLENGTITGGMKTAAGKNRLVPIHPAIRPIIEECVKNDAALFCVRPGQPYTYNTYRRRFVDLMTRFGWSHTCHDTRHTFVTLAKEAGMNEYVLKLIVGHSVKDITERIYTHRSIAQLHAEIEKIVLPT